MSKIQILQNRLLKVLSGKKYRYPTDKLHDEFNLLKVSDITKQETLTFVFNFFMDDLPSVFKNYYETFSNNHNINTRNANLNIRKIRRNNNFGASSIKSVGANLWNDLSIDVKSHQTQNNSTLIIKVCTTLLLSYFEAILILRFLSKIVLSMLFSNFTSLNVFYYQYQLQLLFLSIILFLDMHL